MTCTGTHVSAGQAQLSLGRVACAALVITWLSGCQASAQEKAADTAAGIKEAPKTELATFGEGCFWCSEAVFERVKGVKEVVSGYSGGNVPHPSYKQVCTGLTGHAEVVQITFDPSVISFADLLEIFWKTHDPTTLNRQGPDIGTQYRSVIFYHNDEQRKIAEAYKQQLNESKEFKKPIVTEISPFKAFYPAERYHQDYYELNRRQPYCTYHISPKVRKFNRLFKDKLKDSD